MTIDQLRWGSNIPMISQSLVAMVMGTGIPMCHPSDWPRIWHLPGAAHEKADAAAGSLRDGRSASPAGVEQVDIPSG